ncbi:MAG: hypothetical protein KME10_27940 [Plectolyngbya sp. WJT66-NPBG17]|jgi:hypothetical protein|nr:hypothetical protein [Plectolyngbya sp. WJT66-NPBG17]
MSFARIGRLVLAAGAVTTAVTTMVAGTGTPAHAVWYTWKANVPETSNHAGVAANKRYIGACDTEEDGNGVYTEYEVVGGEVTYRLGDGNGSKDGCGSRTTDSNIIKFRACEDDWGSDTCSGWHYPK